MPQAVFNVEMSCGGCSGACERILKKLDGVSSIDADLKAQTVTVDYAAPATPEAMLEKLQVVIPCEMDRAFGLYTILLLLVSVAIAFSFSSCLFFLTINLAHRATEGNG